MDRTQVISGDLKKWQIQIEGYAKDFGLDFFPTIFELCDYDTINILAAQGGFPSRYPHWKFGMDYDQLSKGYSFGLQKIYEMVINTNPCYAYLLKGNNLVDQKMVMAHVYGHNDFFKNNAWFAGTNRKMMDVMANHGTKVRRYMSLYGRDKVEAFIDKALSIENLIDVNNLFMNHCDEKKEDILASNDHSTSRLSSSLQSFINSKIGKIGLKENSSDSSHQIEQNSQKPIKDVLKFLSDFAPLEEWEADILGILREEAYYFLPQRMTKIMNEGWASYWHSKIMTERAMSPEDVIDFADHHAGVMAMSRKQINPYKIGIELFRDIKYRWDTGRFGLDYQNCEDMKDYENWDLKLNLGDSKIFEIRKSGNDVTFIDEYLTPEFCQRQQIFTYKYNHKNKRFEVDHKDFEAIKSKMLTQLTNVGQPFIEVIDANFDNRAELLLNHRHDGVDLDGEFAQATLTNLHYFWKRPVGLVTKYDDKPVLMRFDGQSFHSKSI